ncbi:beta strand repeat-containing protein [Flavobacterium sp. 3-210]
MAQKHINTDIPNSGNGDALRDAFNKTEDNFNELYANKVDKVSGKGLSTNDYTTADKTKLDGIPADAEKNVQADFLVNDPSSDAYIKNKPAFVTAVNWGEIQGDITNQSDLQNALAEKTDFAYVDSKITQTIFSGTTDFAPSEDAVFNALALKQDTAQKNTANGYAGLDASGKVFSNQLPALAISETFVVASQSAMLALSGAEQGDIAVRTDVNKTFILKQSPYSTLANWQELLTPTDNVTSVFGRVGAVVANSGDYTTALVPDTTNKRYQTDAQAARNDATSSIQTQLDSKQPLITNNITGTGISGQIPYFNGTNTLAGDGGLTWNNSSKKLIIGGIDAPAVVNISSEGSIDPIYLNMYSDDPNYGGSVRGQKYGGTKASPTGVVANSVLTGLYGAGYDGSNMSSAVGAIRILAGGAYSASSRPTYIDFHTTAVGSIGRAERMRIDSNGDVLIGSGVNNTIARLQVNGTISALSGANASQVVINSQLTAVDSNSLHKTGSESFSGIKSSTNSGSSGAINGLSLVNNATDGGSQVLNVTNNDVSIGQRITNNTGAFLGLYVNNLGGSIGARFRTTTGYAFDVQNDSTGTGALFNSASGSTGDLIQFAKNNVVASRFDQNGMFRTTNTGTGSTTGIDVTNAGGAGTQVLTTNSTGGGRGAVFQSNNGSIAAAVENSGAGSGFYISNISTGRGATFDNVSTGALTILNSQPASTGDLLRFTKNGVTTSYFDQNGLFTATNSGSGSTQGIFLTNNGVTSTKVFTVTNTSTGRGIEVVNQSTGAGQVVVNNASGAGFYISNGGSGYGANGDNISTGTLWSLNSVTGSTGDLLTFRKGGTITAKFDQNGILTTPNAVLTGVPTAPTASAGTNTTQIATTAFVTSAVTALNAVLLTGDQTKTGKLTMANPSSGGTQFILTDNGTAAGTINSILRIVSNNPNTCGLSISDTGAGAMSLVSSTSNNPALGVQNTSTASTASVINMAGSGGATMLICQNPSTYTGQFAFYAVNNIKRFAVTNAGIVEANGFSKIGGVYTDFLMADGSTKTGFKAYAGYITQSSTSAPTMTVMENTIGSIVWTRTGAGVYEGTLSGAFTANKTMVLFNGALGNNGKSDTQIISTSVIRITTYAGITATDSMLTGSLEIRVYA